MRIESLQLKDFRNIEELALTPRLGVNVIWGDNGQGKTNLAPTLPETSDAIRMSETRRISSSRVGWLHLRPPVIF